MQIIIIYQHPSRVDRASN